MSGYYDYRMVVLSVFLAVAASYAALDLAGRVTAARGRQRAFWLCGGAIAMGLGIWAMHYIGMLAFSMAMPVLYDYPTVLASLLAAIGASAVALFIVSRRTMGVAQEIVGSVTMGGGIAAMHYIGMAAMRVQARISYDPGMFAFSIVLAMVISLVALVLAFRAREEKHASTRKLVSAIVMGSAIPAMHYTGMAAARFSPTSTLPNLSHAVNITSLGIVAISITSLLVLVLAIVTSFLDRLLAAQKQILMSARENELHFQTLAEAIPQMIWTARANGEVDYFNRRWYDYTGIRSGEVSARSWESVIQVDLLPALLQRWEHSVRTGQVYQNECTFRRGSDGVYRWHLIRALPIKDSAGVVVKWFGTCTDIDDQKSNQKLLEDEVKARTAEVVATNARLKQEMQDRERAQNDLDLQSANMVRELTKASERAVLLNRMGKLLQSSNELEEAFSIVLGSAPKLFPEFRGLLLLLNGPRTALETVGSWGASETTNTSFETNSCWSLRTGRCHSVEPGDHTARCTHGVPSTGSYVCVPIMAQGGALGVLHFQPLDAAHEANSSEISLAETFAEQVGLSIVNLKLQKALRDQSTKDVLTGLFNRRYLEESLVREMQRAARVNQSVGLLMFDLDHFKTFNDTFGHDAGDCILSEIGAFLMRGARAEDIACRYGGEEFVLILPGADLDGAQSRAERLRSKVREIVVVHQGKALGMVTISVGVAAFPAHGLSVKDLMAAADAALYRAKRDGRDRIAVAGMPDAAQAPQFIGELASSAAR